MTGSSGPILKRREVCLTHMFHSDHAIDSAAFSISRILGSVCLIFTKPNQKATLHKKAALQCESP